MKLTQNVKIKNDLGLHARPATFIARILQKSKSTVFFLWNNKCVDARSIMSVLMLALGKDAQLTILVEGDDAEETMQTLMSAFENEFGEKEHEHKKN